MIKKNERLFAAESYLILVVLFTLIALCLAHYCHPAL